MLATSSLRLPEAAARGDELQIIHDEQRKAFVALEAAGLRADFENADGAGVVDPERRGGDDAEGFGHAAPIFFAEMAGAEFVGVNLRDGGDQALKQRLLGHFQAENGRRMAAADGNIFREVQRQSGFSLRWARGKNQQLRRLQAGSELVELAVAGGDAGDAFAFAENALEALEIVADDVL